MNDEINRFYDQWYKLSPPSTIYKVFYGYSEKRNIMADEARGGSLYDVGDSEVSSDGRENPEDDIEAVNLTSDSEITETTHMESGAQDDKELDSEKENINHKDLLNKRAEKEMAVSEEEERQNFLDNLYRFMENKERPILKVPSLGFQELDLYKLYKLVTSRGGMDEVSRMQAWKSVYIDLGLPTMSTSASYNTRTNYKKYLYLYELEHFDPEASSQASENKFRFEIGEYIKINSIIRNRYYYAKVLQKRAKKDVNIYYVHYNGWSNSHDEWVPENVVNKLNEDEGINASELRNPAPIRSSKSNYIINNNLTESSVRYNKRSSMSLDSIKYEDTRKTKNFYDYSTNFPLLGKHSPQGRHRLVENGDYDIINREISEYDPLVAGIMLNSIIERDIREQKGVTEAECHNMHVRENLLMDMIKNNSKKIKKTNEGDLENIQESTSNQYNNFGYRHDMEGYSPANASYEPVEGNNSLFFEKKEVSRCLRGLEKRDEKADISSKLKHLYSDELHKRLDAECEEILKKDFNHKIQYSVVERDDIDIEKQGSLLSSMRSSVKMLETQLKDIKIKYIQQTSVMGREGRHDRISTRQHKNKFISTNKKKHTLKV